jgi:D-alanyl-D-alanine carboxypeptidase
MRKMVFVLMVTTLFCAACSKDSQPDPDPPPGPPDPVTQKDISSIDAAVENFRSTYKIPGVSIAITKNEKLVYLKSYGTQSNSDNTPVTNTSLYRIASVSKPITAVGIMKLLEAKKLTLDSKVFGDGSILGNDYNTTQIAALSDITVRHLLHHTSGAWPNDGTDPMFKQPTYNFSQLIKWTLDTYPAKSNRGVYKYSNFGYCLLGRVIEKLSGKTYVQFIKDEVLAPAGITSMEIGGSTLADRKANEVLYNGQNGENPYLYNIPRMDAHGGWIASAKDLAKLIVKVDGFSAKPDILQPATITTMTTRSVPSSNYACGWGVNNANHWWHVGSLPGTTTEIIRSASGYNWVILCNSRSTSSTFLDAIDGLLWPIVNNTSTPWQNIDQF